MVSEEELAKRKPLKYLDKSAEGIELDEVQLHPRIRWRTMHHRPIYKYCFNAGYMDYVSFITGSVVGLLMFILAMLFPDLLGSELLNTYFMCLPGLLLSFIISFVIINLLFFTNNRRAFTGSLYSLLSQSICFIVLNMLYLSFAFSIDVFGSIFITLAIASGLIIFYIAVYVRISKTFGRISLYSDGFVIGSEVFNYSDIEYINYAAGPVDRNIKPEHANLPRIIMSELEFSYKGKDYEIDHFYLVCVKSGKLYICQSIMFTSAFAANSRNGLKHYDYMKSKGVLFKIFR